MVEKAKGIKTFKALTEGVSIAKKRGRVRINLLVVCTIGLTLLKAYIRVKLTTSYLKNKYITSYTSKLF